MAKKCSAIIADSAKLNQIKHSMRPQTETDREAEKEMETAVGQSKPPSKLNINYNKSKWSVQSDFYGSDFKLEDLNDLEQQSWQARLIRTNPFSYIKETIAPPIHFQLRNPKTTHKFPAIVGSMKTRVFDCYIN